MWGVAYLNGGAVCMYLQSYGLLSSCWLQRTLGTHTNAHQYTRTTTHTHIHKARTPNCHKLGLCCISLPASLLLLSWIGCGCGCGCGCLQHSLKEKKALLLQADNYIFVENWWVCVILRRDCYPKDPVNKLLPVGSRQFLSIWEPIRAGDIC